MAAIVRRGQHHHQRADMADLINPDNGVRGRMKRLGKEVKDHMKENRAEIRQLERKNRDMKEDEARPAKELYKLPQFRDVEPKLYEIEESDRPRVENFLTKNQAKKRHDDLILESRAQREELEAKMEEARYFADNKSTTPRDRPVPKATEVARLAPRSNTDFINKNRIRAQVMVPGSSLPTGHGAGGGVDSRYVEDASGAKKHQSFGRVPEYLENRKNRWAEEQEEVRRRAPDPDCPPGMCLMPEDERLSTLDTLTTSRDEVLRLLRNMPFVVETPSQKKKQSDLEAKMREIERAIGLFSKPKVYIASDRY